MNIMNTMKTNITMIKMNIMNTMNTLNTIKLKLNSGKKKIIKFGKMLQKLQWLKK